MLKGRKSRGKSLVLGTCEGFTANMWGQINAGGVTNDKAPLEPPRDILQTPFQSTIFLPKYCLKLLNGRKKGESICKKILRQMIEPN